MLTQITARRAKDGDGRLFGLILGDSPTAIDITDEQLDAVQAAVDAGSVDVDGFKKSEPKPAPKAEAPKMAMKAEDDAPKGKGK